MNPGNAQAAVARLQGAHDQLMKSWEETREHWDDANAEAFEKDYLQPLTQELRSAVPALDELSQLLRAAYRDCHD